MSLGSRAGGEVGWAQPDPRPHCRLLPPGVFNKACTLLPYSLLEASLHSRPTSTPGASGWGASDSSWRPELRATE